MSPFADLLAASIIDRVGSFVGFFALLGLAILALLYFSQARDVRRLREWAGRAPERAAEAEVRTAAPVVTQAQPQTPNVVRKAAPPATAPAAPGSTAPATAAAKAAAGPGTPAGVTAAGGAPPATEPDEATDVGPGSDNGDEPADDTGEQVQSPKQLPDDAQPVAEQPTVAHTPVEPLEHGHDEPSAELEELEPFDPLPSDEHYLPGTSYRDAGERRRKPMYKRVRNVHIPGGGKTLAGLLGVVVLVVALSVGGVIGGGGDGEKVSKRSQRADRGQNAGGGSAAAVDPAQVTVAVLNGTTTTGLAYRVSQEATTGGFTLGTVTNAATTDQVKSEVLYVPDQKNAARAVADRLGISTIAPIDSVNSEIAGSADAIVLVGADRG